MERPDTCLFCDAPVVQLGQGRPRRYHSDLCRRAGGRFEKRFKPFLTLILDAMEGKTPKPRPPGWGLLVELVMTELHERRIEIRHRRTP